MINERGSLYASHTNLAMLKNNRGQMLLNVTQNLIRNARCISIYNMHAYILQNLKVMLQLLLKMAKLKKKLRGLDSTK
jgi:hypothetical protein